MDHVAAIVSELGKELCELTTSIIIKVFAKCAAVLVA